MTLLERLDRVRARTRRPAPVPAPADPRLLAVQAGGAGVLSALVGAALTELLVLVVWGLTPHPPGTPVAVPARVGGVLWLLAHHVPSQVGSGSVGLAPLGLLAVPGAFAWLGGRQVARAVDLSAWADVGRALGVFVLGYAVVGAVVAGLARGGDVRADPVAALVGCGLLAALAGGVGLLGLDGLKDLWDLLPATARPVLAAAAGGVTTLLAGGAVLGAGALLLGFDDAVSVTRALHAGPVGGVALALLGAAFVPTLVLWASAVAAGPGFALGAGSTVSAAHVSYGPLPAFPALAALPPEGRPGPAGLLVLLVPLAAGAVVGVLLHRRTRHETPHRLAAAALAAGGVAGVATAALAALSGGGLGGGALAVVGPSPLWLGLAVAAELGLVAAVVVWELHRRTAR